MKLKNKLQTNPSPRRNHTKDFIFVHFYNSYNTNIHPFKVNPDVFRLFTAVQPPSLPNFRILYRSIPSRSHSSLEIVYTNHLPLFTGLSFHGWAVRALYIFWRPVSSDIRFAIFFPIPWVIILVFFFPVEAQVFDFDKA